MTSVNPEPDDDPADDPRPFEVPGPPAGFGRSSYFDNPVDGAPPTPSTEDAARVRLAHVRSRLFEIHTATHSKITGAIDDLGNAIAEALACRARFGMATYNVREAELEHNSVLALPPPPGGSRYEAYTSAVGGIVTAAILFACFLGDYLVDKGALLIFRLPLAFTHTLALVIAVVQTLSAHTVGNLTRRLTEAIDRDELWRERRKMNVLIGLIALIAVSLSIVRAARGNVIMGALVLGVAGASAVVAVTISYLHANSRRKARKATGRELTRKGNKAANEGRDMVRAEAKETSARNALMAAAADVVARIDLVYINKGLDPVDEPAWILQLRDWAAGRNLPFAEALR